jgi:protein-S-isoprenylcysteine O-methyltransferase Ste14
MGRVLGIVYGVVVYVVFLAVFVYAIGFVGNLLVPKGIDSGEEGVLATSLLINFGLLCVFALQHNVMARPWFKAAWTKVVPQQVERSTFVLFTNAALALLFWQWRPLTGVIWEVENQLGASALLVVSLLGWGIVLLATFLINHFDLFGLRQVFLWDNYSKPMFKEQSLYRHTRHPLYLGFLIAFWATPQMTVGHLFFSVVTTAFILWSIQFEEHDLAEAHSEYRAYQKRVPMLLPLGRKSPADPSVPPGEATGAE